MLLLSRTFLAFIIPLLTFVSAEILEETPLKAQNVSGDCKKIWLQPDPCLYSRNNCQNLVEGKIDFIDVYYCKVMPSYGAFCGMMLLLTVLGFTFLFLSTIASDFFCPNLSSIAKALNLSESVAGVTFLAFGNGSPDLFSTFSALKAGSGALALGELVGAAWFVISVIVGSMAIIKSFQLNRRLFLRDLLFFTGAVIFMCYIIIRGELSIAVSFSLVIYYLLYVIIVISAKPEVEKELEKDEEELEGLLMSNLEYTADNEETSLLVTQLAQDVDRSSTGMIPHTTPITYYKRMNFWTADEIAKAFDVDSTERRDIPRLFRRNTEFFSVSSRLNSSISRALSIAPRSRIRSYSSPLVGESAGNLEATGQGSRQSLWKAQPNFLRANAPDMIFISNSEETMNISASPSEISTTAEFEESSNFSDVTENASLWELLFPGFSGFRKLTAMEKFTNLICAPLILPLILTIPVVTMPTTAEAPMIIVSPPSESAASLGNSPVNYSQDILVALQFFFIPTFLLESIMDGMSCKPDITWIILAGGLVSLISVATQTAIRRACLSWEIPGFTLLCALFGFMLALVWISIAATEVVDILRALGVILGINEEIIGLTVFAMGNSLGDFVANLSVARMGYPTMAVSACFAGPMLSKFLPLLSLHVDMMLGPGLAGVYLSLTRSETIIIPSSRIMILSAAGVLITLVVYNIYVHINRFYIDRRFGGFLIGVYFFGMAINLLLTYHHRSS